MNDGINDTFIGKAKKSARKQRPHTKKLDMKTSKPPKHKYNKAAP